MKICYSDFYYCQKWENKEGYVYALSRWAGILFPCMLPTKGDTQHIFSSRISSCSFSHPSRALQSLPTYFRGAFLYPAAWTPGIAWCLRVTSGRLTITLHCPNILFSSFFSSSRDKYQVFIAMGFCWPARTDEKIKSELAEVFFFFLHQHLYLGTQISGVFVPEHLSFVQHKARYVFCQHTLICSLTQPAPSHHGRFKTRLRPSKAGSCWQVCKLTWFWGTRWFKNHQKSAKKRCSGQVQPQPHANRGGYGAVLTTAPTRGYRAQLVTPLLLGFWLWAASAARRSDT